jgi:hypothetical protein
MRGAESPGAVASLEVIPLDHVQGSQSVTTVLFLGKVKLLFAASAERWRQIIGVAVVTALIGAVTKTK